MGAGHSRARLPARRVTTGLASRYTGRLALPGRGIMCHNPRIQNTAHELADAFVNDYRPKLDQTTRSQARQAVFDAIKGDSASSKGSSRP